MSVLISRRHTDRQTDRKKKGGTDRKTHTHTHICCCCCCCGGGGGGGNSSSCINKEDLLSATRHDLGTKNTN